MNLYITTSFKLFIVVVFINLSGLAIINFAHAVEPEEFLNDPLDVYGKTKSLGEVLSENILNIRCLPEYQVVN